MTQTATIHDYFNALIALIEQHYVSPSQIDKPKSWNFFKDIPEEAENKIALVRNATHFTLSSLNKHSFYIYPFTHHEDGSVYVPPLPEGRIEDGNIAYISLPEAISSPADNARYAQTGFDITIKLLEQNPIGAIVDLRKNGGGSCDPMLAAIGPLLDKENFVGWANERDVVGSGITWDHAVGHVAHTHGLRKSIPPLPAGNPNTSLPVAVIYGGVTCSSGEVVALALKGSSLSKSFGEATFGNTSANCAFPTPFPDIFGSGFFALTTAKMADRQQNIYNNIKIKPDVPCDNPVERAIEWIRAFPR